jgi:bla regulator protein BlaR1
MAGSMVMFDSVRIIGWVLLHFLWQGVAVGMLYSACRPLLPRGHWRYRVGMGALLVLAACPLMTAWRLLDVAPAMAAGSSGSSGSTAALSMPALAVTTATGIPWSLVVDRLLPWCVLMWSAGVVLLSFRTWRQWRLLKVLVSAAEHAPAWQLRLNVMAGRFGLRRQVAVLSSKLVLTPVLVGWIRPVILLPLAVACEFPLNQVELILAHELGHLKRWDPLSNLFQVVLETLHFYHPVVHWISRDVRNEREICCDQLALATTGGSRHEFAATLAKLGELRENPGALLLAASGGVLLDRVQYMVLQHADSRQRPPSRLVPVVLGALMILFTLRLEWSHQRAKEAPDQVAAWLPSLATPLAIDFRQPQMPALNLTVRALLPQPLLLHPSVKAPPARTSDGEFDARFAKTLMTTAPLALAPVNALPSLPRLLAPTLADTSPLPSLPAARAMPHILPAGELTPLHIRQPIYPQAALLHGEQGQVVIEFELAGDGTLQDMRVVQSEPVGIFDQAALRAMRGWKYPAPAAATGTQRYRQTMIFVLNAALAGRRIPSASQIAGEKIQARADCQIVTGTHICRWPGDGV